MDPSFPREIIGVFARIDPADLPPDREVLVENFQLERSPHAPAATLIVVSRSNGSR